MPIARRLVPYGVALAAVGVSILARIALDPVLRDRLPFVTFYFAITVAAWFGGTSPSLLAVGLTLVAAEYFFVPPHGPMALWTTTGAVGAAAYLFVGTMIALLGGSMWRARRRAEAGVRRTTSLAEEAESARADADAARRRVAFLAEASAVLGSSLDTATTLEHVARLAVSLLADYCVIDVASGEGEMRRVAVAHADPAKQPLVERLRLLQPRSLHMTRVARVVETGEPDVVPALDIARVAATIPPGERRDTILALAPRGYIVVALRARGRTLGTMTFVAAESGRVYGDADVALAQELARRAAMAIDNARLHEDERRARGAAEAARERAAFLAEASVLLSSTLDYRQTLPALARLAVSGFADWCLVDLVGEDGATRRVALAGRDPEAERLALEIDRRFTLPEVAPYGPPRVIRDGKPELVSELPADFFTALARDPVHLDLLKQFPFTSYLCVPLAARGRIFGAISLASAESNRHYGEDDLALAEEIARRAALAIDNARLYEAEQRARAEAEEANRAKDEFLTTVSHELRTPLQAILGWVAVLRQGRLSEARTQRAIDIIEQSGRAQAALIGDLLDVSRIVTGRLRLDLRPVDLPAVLKAAVDTIRPAAQAKHIAVACHIDPAADMVAGDPDRLKQIAWNLLSNAVKFTPDGGSVELRLEVTATTARIVVADTGEGIPAHFLPHVFERFQQAEATHSTKPRSGVGLGLAIVRHLVELHGGRVEAASPGPGQGATFTVVLPRTLDPRALMDEREAAHDERQAAHKRRPGR